MDISTLRQNYAKQTLLETEVLPDPIAQFDLWFKEAMLAQVPEPNAMTLATVGKDGRPTARVVLLKEVDAGSFVWYTNYGSRKSADLAQNPYAAIVFCWLELERQVRIEGIVEKVDMETARAYFQSRPKSSQIGAWSSAQSSKIASRDILDKKAANLEEKYADLDTLPLPFFWGGFRLIPDRIEFWQGRESRLHDRLVFEKQEDYTWQVSRLAP